jgi:subtilisin family serine protease
MKLTFYTLFLSFLSINLFSQKVAPNTYVIRFKDKDTTSFSITKPNEFLSERALLRRQKYNIPVTLQDIPVNENYIKTIKDLGIEIFSTSKWLNHIVVYTEDSLLIETVLKLSFVNNETNSVLPKEKLKNKKNKEINIISSRDETSILDYGSGANQVKMLNVHQLHNNGFMGQGIQIAVLDAGFYNADSLSGFDSIRTNNQILGTRDFVERDGDIYRDATHGMSVLSTIAANIPGKLIGTAPKASFWLFRSEDERSEYYIEEYYWLNAAEYADSLGVDMIHSSLGYNEFDDTISNHKYSDMDGNTAISSIAADIASSKGILVVTSAGNEGNDPWKYISAPADADDVLSVGATNGNGKVANFSSRGPSSDKRVKPDVMAQGSFVWVLDANGRISISFGTSFSGPIIAGAVACLWQANPQFSNLEIIDAVKKSSNYYTNPDSDYGYGIPDFNKADKYLKQLLNERTKK